MKDRLQLFLDKHGLKARLIPAARMGGLEDDFKKVSEEGFVSKRVADIYFKNFSFNKPEGMKDFRSIIIISMARPIHRLGLNYKGKSVSVLIPPTYVNYQKVNGRVFNLFKSWINSYGGNAYVARLPLKLLSVRSGLARYGRNNISYVEKWGSFHQLMAFFTDLDAKDDPIQEPSVLDACKTCDLCSQNCPTGAIRRDRFVLDAARCLTFLNESEEDIPVWIDPRAHNSLIGCMRCQDICPYNKKVKSWIEDIGELGEEETDMLLDFDSIEDGDAPIIKRVKEMGIYEFFTGLIPRNLRLLLNNMEFGKEIS